MFIFLYFEDDRTSGYTRYQFAYLKWTPYKLLHFQIRSLNIIDVQCPIPTSIRL